MIKIKNKQAIAKMHITGLILADLFEHLAAHVAHGVSTLFINDVIQEWLIRHKCVSQTKGYRGYAHASCISINDEVVHGVPSAKRIVRDGDIVKIDVCAALDGYCADMARIFYIGSPSPELQKFGAVAQAALDKGIEKARVGNHLSDISAAIEAEVKKAGFGVVKDFAGHGIGKNMHEDPEVLNYGVAGQGPILRHGMALAIEPMITQGHYDVFVDKDGWTVKTVDKSMAAHVEDTIVILEEGPKILTRHSKLL